jgi:hypothetical protein
MEYEEERHSYLPNMNYETDLSTRDFIYFVQDYSQFLIEYINNRYPDDPEEIGYLTSFIEVCDGINTDVDQGEEYYERFRASIQPFMEWLTLWAEDMNNFYEYNYQQRIEPELVEAKGVASRTRSKRPIATNYEMPPAKRGRNAMTLEPTKQQDVRIKLSDGKEYTYSEIKQMWEWNKTITPYRHPYTSEDKQKIKDIIEFATKGGKRTRKTSRKGKKTRKTRKIKNKKLSRRTRRN